MRQQTRDLVGPGVVQRRSLYVPGAMRGRNGSRVENAVICGVSTPIEADDWSLRHVLNVLAQLGGDRSGRVPKDIDHEFVMAFAEALRWNYDGGGLQHVGSFRDLEDVRGFVKKAARRMARGAG